MSDAPATVAQALAWGRAQGVERGDARGLVAHALGCTRSWVIAHGESALPPPVSSRVVELLGRRAAGEPYAYLVGQREFHGIALAVTPAVLIPRADTETLVDWALEILRGPLSDVAAPQVLDLGTGSGAVALALKHTCSRAQVSATDVSPAALAVASANGARLGLAVDWRLGSWWDAVDPAAARGGWHLIVSNPPYVAPDDPHLATLAFEPGAALVPSGDRGDGLSDLARITAGAPARLRRGGWLLLEHGADQGAAVRELLQHHGFESVATRMDLAGLERATGGRRAT